jgi:hypothetical protein
MRWVAAVLVAALIGAAASYVLGGKRSVPGRPPQTAANLGPARVAPGERVVEKVSEPVAKEAGSAAATPAVAAAFPSKSEQAAREGRGRIFGTAVLPADAPRGLPISVALHLVDTKSPEVSYDDTLIGTVEIGGDGAFEFTGLPMGSFVVLASATGYTMNGGARLTPERVEWEVTLNLVPGGTISGRVVNQNHAPVVGAHVFVGGWNIQNQKLRAPRDRALASQRVTDAAGAFTMEDLRKSLNNEPGYQLAVKAEGYATLVSDYIQAGTQGVELMVKPGGVVSGRLVNAATDEALPDKTVSLDSTLTVEKLTAQTDAEGFFFVPDVPAGEQTASLRDDELVITPDTAKIHVADGAPTGDVVLKAALGGKVSGRVYNSETGEGIAKVKIYAYAAANEGAAPKEISTNAEGAYSFKGLKAGPNSIEYIKPEGYPRNYQNADRHLLVIFAEIGKEITGVDFALTRGLLISGKVVDEAGNPIAQAGVSGYASRGNVSDNSGTREDGSFVLAGFSVGQEVNVSALKEGYALMSVEPPKGKVTVAEGGASGVRLVLGQAGSISGTVVSKSGRPMPSVQMYVSSPSQATSGVSGMRSGADGSITFPRLAPGEYTFIFDGMPDPAKGAQHVTLHKGEQITGVRILYPELGGLKITGRVKDTKGNGIASADVIVYGPMYRRAPTDTEGKYTVDGLPAGNVQIGASSSAYSSGVQRTAQAGDTNVDFVLKDFAKIEGRVVSAQTAQPVTAFRVRTPGRRGDQFQAISDPQGRFTLSEVEDRAMSLDVRAEGFADTSVPLSGIVGGETRRDVLVRMETGVELAGRVVDTSGKGVGGAHIFLGAVPHESQRDRQQRATSSGDGSFRLTSLPAGQVQISASHPKYAPKTVTANLTPRVENRVEIALSTGGTVEGLVTLDGKPFAGASINAMTRNGTGQQGAQTDAQGRYRIAGLPDGPFHLNPTLNAPGVPFRSKTVQIEITEGYVTEMNFNFVSGSSTIEGTIYEAPNQPLRGQANINVTVQIADGSSEYSGAQTDGSGGFLIEGVPAGQAKLQLYLQGRSPKSVNVAIGERQRVRQDILLYGGATVHVSVSAAGEQVVVLLRGTVQITELSMQLAQSLESQSAGDAPVVDGQATFTGLEPGTYTVLAIAVDPATIRNGGDPFATAKWATKVVKLARDQEVSVAMNL